MRLLFAGLFCFVFGSVMMYVSYQKEPAEAKPIAVFYGIASFYGSRYGFHGKCMTDGRIYNKEGMTAANRDLLFGTIARVIRVTKKGEKRSVVVTFTDSGPWVYDEHGNLVKERNIDLSEAAARELGFIEEGITPVTIEVLFAPKKSKKYHHANPQCLKEHRGKPQQSALYAKTQ